MALPVQQMAEQAFELAKSLTPDAFKAATVRLAPTQGTYDPATDQSTTTWGHEISARLLQYDDSNERADQPIDATMTVFLASMADLRQSGTNDQDIINEDAQIEITGAETWDVYRTEVDPSGSVAMFYCRR